MTIIHYERSGDKFRVAVLSGGHVDVKGEVDEIYIQGRLIKVRLGTDEGAMKTSPFRSLVCSILKVKLPGERSEKKVLACGETLLSPEEVREGIHTAGADPKILRILLRGSTIPF